ncbi:hypothetical protein V5799_006497 [Amblyomma americanum]|uniref:Uncharacterized protein n=1 Tax=Amblyomma americanum TaxID=6943 RepID=A0AAQ4DW82_AMBAM
MQRYIISDRREPVLQSSSYSGMALQRALQHALQQVLQHALQQVLQHALQQALQHALQQVLQQALQHALAVLNPVFPTS